MSRISKFPLPKNELYWWDENEGVYKPLTEDGVVSVKIAGTEDTGTGSLGVTVKESDVMVGVDIQGKYTKTVQTHTAVTVPATTGYNTSAWIDTEGFDKISIALLNDASTANSASIAWSHDGVTVHGNETNVLPSNTTNQKIAVTEVKARFCRVIVYNTDASVHVMSAWAYLKY